MSPTARLEMRKRPERPPIPWADLLDGLAVVALAVAILAGTLLLQASGVHV